MRLYGRVSQVKVARYTVLLLLGVSLGVGALGYWFSARRTISDLKEQLAQAKGSQRNLLEQKLANVRTGDVRVQGKIEAAEAVAVSPRVEAPIARVLVQEGQTVQAGEVLIELADTGLRAALEEQTSVMHLASRCLADVERRYPDRETLYREAVEDVELTYRNAVAAFEKALADSERDIAKYAVELQSKRLEVKRMHELAAEALVSQTDSEKAELDLKRAEFEAEAVKALHADLRRKVAADGEYVRLRQAELDRQQGLQRAEEERITDADLAGARAALQEAQLLVDLAKQNIEAAQVRASIKGVVTAASRSPRLKTLIGSSQTGTGRALSFEELREVGKQVSPRDILFVIEGLDAVVVKIQVDEIDINRIKVGDPARITGMGFADKPLKGEVSNISPKATYVAEGITTFETTVKVIEELGRARLGMSAEAAILVGGAQ